MSHPPSPGPIRVLISIPHALVAEAYAARINREPGWVAQPAGAEGEWDVRLADRCRVDRASPLKGPTVVVADGPAADEPSCSCCQTFSRGAAWPSVFRALADAAGRSPNAEELRLLAKLTRREMDVLRLVGMGKTVGQIADSLGVSPSTVGNHKYRLMRKLGVGTSLELLRIAVRNGLADLD